jgi:uncharacterized repeat protein (TIGR01451 family)
VSIQSRVVGRFAAALVGAAAIGALALPGVASANTGSVTCDNTGVVFSYDAHFGRAKVATETVNGVSKQFTVPKYTATTDTWPVFGTLTVGSTWSGGSIPTVTLVCPPPAPPLTPPVAPPIAPPVAPPVSPPVVAPPAAPVTPSVVSSPAPRITLSKKAGARTVQVGTTVNYRLIVKATGGTAHDVVVCDKLPAHMTYVSLGSATLQGGEACWTVGDLTGSRSLSFRARVDRDASAGTLVNNATATSSNAGRAVAHASIKVPERHAVKGAVKGQAERSAGVTG